MIDKEKLQAQIIALQSLLDSQENACDYEKVFDEKWQAITREVFESSLGAIPHNKNKKKSSD